MIETHGLTRRFAGNTAVDHLDLVVSGPGLVGFLGPNGAGKTTTLRMLTGFLAMTEGVARVAGFDVFEQPVEVKARVGYQPETPPLHPELTVGEYLLWVAEIRGVARGRRLSRVGEVMERVGLRGFERRLCGALSKGYRQRVSLAQAIVHDPAVLFLDEPTSGLDPAQLVGIRALIRELAVDRLVMLSTHLLVEVEMLCARVLMLHKGRLVGDGSVESLAAGVGAGAWLELVTDDDGTDRSAALAGLASVVAVRRLGAGQYRLEGECGAEVVSLAVARGWHVRELTRHRASLEEVFLALVGVEA